MRALVTGSRGFVGPHLVDLLLRHGVDVLALGKADEYIEYFPGFPASVRLLEGDICDANFLAPVLRDFRPDQIYHLAGISSVPLSFSNPRLTYSVNVNGLLNLLESCREFQLPARIVNVSTALVYGSCTAEGAAFTEDSPLSLLSPYAHSKAMAEQLAAFYSENFGLDVVTVRPFNHIGAFQPPGFVCSDFARQVAFIRHGMQPPVITTGNLNAERDFTDVRDVVRAYWLLATSGRSGVIYNVCSGKPRRISDVLNALVAGADQPVEVRTAADPLRPKDASRVLGDASRIATEVGWKPEIPWEQTVAGLLDYWNARVAADAQRRAAHNGNA